MNYEKLYFKFIEKWKSQEIEIGTYTEKHHIIPRHCGGSDNESNLLVLTYKQHTFAHRLLWKSFGYKEDLAAWKLMSSIEESKKFILCSMAGSIGGKTNRDSGHASRMGKKQGPITGRSNVDSGHLDDIRGLINKEDQRERARLLGKENAENGVLDRAREIAIKNRKENGVTEETKERLRGYNKILCERDDFEELMRNLQKSGNEAKKRKSKEFSEFVIETAERNEEHLHKVHFNSKYFYVSPEGLKFGASSYAASYYGNVSAAQIANWCKREQHGWYREKIS